MVKQKEIIAVELHDKELNRYSKTEYAVISREEYNKVTKHFVACEVVYSTNIRPYFIPIKVTGLRKKVR